MANVFGIFSLLFVDVYNLIPGHRLPPGAELEKRPLRNRKRTLIGKIGSFRLNCLLSNQSGHHHIFTLTPIIRQFFTMDNDQYNLVFELEREGKKVEALQLLQHLADEDHPMALLELSMRYFSTDGYTSPVLPLEPDNVKSDELSKRGKEKLEELAEAGDGEAMRILAYTYLGLIGIDFEKSVELGEKWLLKAYEANCYFAANDLASFYQGSDLEKAKHYYQEAERHGCRVIKNENLE